MQTFIREKKILCGKEYREVDIFEYTAMQKIAAGGKRRGNQRKESAPKQKNLNDLNARRYFTQLANMNFAHDPNAMHVSVTYSPKYLPATIKDAEKEISNYLRRLQHKCKGKGLPDIKYMVIDAYSTARGGEKLKRIHHHIILSCALDRDEVENLWRKRKKRGQRQGDKIGYINADRLQCDDNGISALCTYLVKQAGGKKRWSSSRNLDRPSSVANDEKYTRKQIDKIAKEHRGREFWEKKYPGWTLTNDDHGVTYKYNEYTGWSVYLKLRKKKRSDGA